MNPAVGSVRTWRSGPLAGWSESAVLGLLALAWGLAMAPRGYAPGDGSELTLALALAGAPHPTGYPLYVLGGHLFARLLHAAGVSWPVAANAWSAVGGAAAVLFLHRLAKALAADLLPERGPWRTVLPLLPFPALLVQPIWSAAATGAEVYSWHAAWIAIACAAAWTLGAPTQAPTAGSRAALLWGVIAGAGAAHHATSLLVSGPLTVWLVRRRAAARGSLLGPFALGAALPLAAYGWIAHRAAHPAAYQWPLLEPGVAGLLTHATGRAYGGYLGGLHPTPPEGALLLSAVPWLALALPSLAAAAFARSGGAGRSFARAALAAAGLQALFLLLYRVPDPSAHALPLLALGTLWLPRAVALVAARTGAAAAGLLLLAAMVGVMPWWVSRDLERRAAAEREERLVRRAWDLVPFERGLVLWENDLHARLRAFQILEGSHPERTVVHPGVLSWEGPRSAFRARHGFDPWEGALPERESELAPRLARAAARAGLPVEDFRRTLRLAAR